MKPMKVPLFGVMAHQLTTRAGVEVNLTIGQAMKTALFSNLTVAGTTCIVRIKHHSFARSKVTQKKLRKKHSKNYSLILRSNCTVSIIMV